MNWAEWVLAVCGTTFLGLITFSVAYGLTADWMARASQKTENYRFYKKCAREVMRWSMAGEPTIEQCRDVSRVRIEARQKAEQARIDAALARARAEMGLPKTPPEDEEGYKRPIDAWNG